jgi:hypothetical protein
MSARDNRGIVTILDVTRKAVVVEQLSKYVSVETNTLTCNNRRDIFSVRSVPRDYKKDKEDRLSQLSFETPACQDMSLGSQELNWGIKAPELFNAVQLRVKSPAVKTLCVL